MFNISNYLKRVSKTINFEETSKQKLSEIIKANTNIDVEVKLIEIKNYVAYIKSSQAVLNKIFINKEKILNDFSKENLSKIVDLK